MAPCSSATCSALALVIGGVVTACLALATRLLGRWSSARFHHLAQSLIPLAGCGVFLGLSTLTVTLLRNEGSTLAFVGPLRAALLVGAGAWSLWLGWRIAGLYGKTSSHRIAALLPLAIAVVVSGASWGTLFWKL